MLKHLTYPNFNFFRGQTYNQSYGTKPDGLWLSPLGLDSWIEYHNEHFTCFGDRMCIYDVIVDLSDVLVISNVTEFDEFTEKASDKWGVSWPIVTSRYKGISIIPYLWSRRHVPWYYPWDCKSVCIWDLSAILSIESTQELNNAYVATSRI